MWYTYHMATHYDADFKRHFARNTPEYRAWRDAKSRCNNPNHAGHKNYGGRGITMCKRWQESFQSFLDDMGQRPTAQHTLDRIDNEGNYEPGNCRWATWTEQHRNRRNSRLLTCQGETLPMCAWAEKYGIATAAIANRIESGWSVERAITRPTALYQKGQCLTFNGETLNLTAWGERLGITGASLRDRLDRYGWSVERALTEPRGKRGRPRKVDV